jgi:hypothetical protein
MSTAKNEMKKIEANKNRILEIGFLEMIALNFKTEIGTSGTKVKFKFYCLIFGKHSTILIIFMQYLLILIYFLRRVLKKVLNAISFKARTSFFKLLNCVNFIYLLIFQKNFK